MKKFKKPIRSRFGSVDYSALPAKKSLGNEKLTTFTKSEACPKCKMMKDPGERGICKYCRRLNHEGTND